MTKWGAKDFLTDLRTGMSSQELMRKYNLSEERFNQILGRLRRSDMTAHKAGNIKVIGASSV
jgi:Mor family transcriptional regulator